MARKTDKTEIGKAEELKREIARIEKENETLRLEQELARLKKENEELKKGKQVVTPSVLPNIRTTPQTEPSRVTAYYVPHDQDGIINGTSQIMVYAAPHTGRRKRNNDYGDDFDPLRSMSYCAPHDTSE